MKVCLGVHTHLEPMVGSSLNIHPAANGGLVETLGDKGGEERNWPPYLTMPMAQDKCPLQQALPNI